ncbi:MAG: HPr family phosphocarrier protein [Lachnospiraceae bacterium]|nr:HPr family phosphocarrier protein [Lachnospiraceae bacterium]
MISRKILIETNLGLHLRPVGILCQRAQDFSCKVAIEVGDDRVNGKSVISVLGVGIKNGDEIELICDGPDEKEAMDALIEVMEHGLE